MYKNFMSSSNTSSDRSNEQTTDNRTQRCTNFIRNSLSCGKYELFTCWDKHWGVCTGFVALIIIFLVASGLCISIFSVSMVAMKELEEFDETIVSPFESIVDMFEPKSLQPCFYPSSDKYYNGYYACNSKLFLYIFKFPTNIQFSIVTLSPVTQYCPIGYKCKNTPLKDSDYYPCIKKNSDCSSTCIDLIQNIPFVEDYRMKGITYSITKWPVILEGCVIPVMTILYLVILLLSGKDKECFGICSFHAFTWLIFYFLFMWIGYPDFDGSNPYSRYAYCFEGPGTVYLDQIDTYSRVILGLLIASFSFLLACTVILSIVVYILIIRIECGCAN